MQHAKRKVHLTSREGTPTHTGMELNHLLPAAPLVWKKPCVRSEVQTRTHQQRPYYIHTMATSTLRTQESALQPQQQHKSTAAVAILPMRHHCNTHISAAFTFTTVAECVQVFWFLTGRRSTLVWDAPAQ